MSKVRGPHEVLNKAVTAGRGGGVGRESRRPMHPAGASERSPIISVGQQPIIRGTTSATTGTEPDRMAGARSRSRADLASQSSSVTRASYKPAFPRSGAGRMATCRTRWRADVYMASRRSDRGPVSMRPRRCGMKGEHGCRKAQLLVIRGRQRRPPGGTVGSCRALLHGPRKHRMAGLAERVSSA